MRESEAKGGSGNDPPVRRTGATRYGAGTLVVFSAPAFAFAFVLTPANAILPNVYATETSLTLAAIGLVLLVSRIFDAVTDQLIGYLSDRTRGRLGPRKPWLLAGLPLFMTAVWFLFNPSPDTTIVYFAVWSFLFYLGFTMVYVPHLAWASELAPDYKERSRVFTVYSVTQQSGQLLVFSGPLILFSLGLLASSEMNADYMTVLTWAFILAFPAAVALAVWRAPVGPFVSAEPISFRTIFKSLTQNRPLLRYMTVLLLYGLGQGAFAALIIVYFDSYLGIADKFAYILMGMGFVSIVSLYPWMKVVRRFGKHRPWAISWIGSIALMPLMALVEPGPYVLVIVLALFLLRAFFESVSNVVASAMLGDIVDYDTLKTGSEKAGSFYALQGLMVKVAAACGAGAAFILLDVVGYSIREPDSNGFWAHAGFLAIFLLLPAVLKGVSIFLIWNFPIDERRHGIIRNRLDQLALRSETARRAVDVTP